MDLIQDRAGCSGQGNRCIRVKAVWAARAGEAEARELFVEVADLCDLCVDLPNPFGRPSHRCSSRSHRSASPCAHVPPARLCRLCSPCV